LYAPGFALELPGQKHDVSSLLPVGENSECGHTKLRFTLFPGQYWFAGHSPHATLAGVSAASP
jgi:hypothetical protein